MNLNKARDFYSAYYEGSLDAGLTQAFERALENEAEVKAEYEQFVRIMKDLDGLGQPVDVPDNLHLMIRDRVDAHILATEGKDKSGAGFFAWRPLAYGAVAAAAVIGVLFSLSGQGNNELSEGAILSDVTDSPPTITAQGKALTLNFASADKNGVTIYDTDGQTIYQRSLDSQKLECPLTNSTSEATVVRVEFAQGYSPLTVGVPGTTVITRGAGIGSISDFVKAIADSYAVPVVLDVQDASQNVSWNFENSDVAGSISDELAELGLKSEIGQDGVLWISSE